MRIKRRHTNSPSFRKLLKRKKDNNIIEKAKEVGFVNRSKKGSFMAGVFWSHKNDKALSYRSSYELAFYHLLEADEKVLTYLVEPFHLPYFSPLDHKMHRYYPDLLVLYSDSKMELIEIKPVTLIRDIIVQVKARAARAYIIREGLDAEFRFVSEEDIFKSAKDYGKLMKMFKK